MTAAVTQGLVTFKTVEPTAGLRAALARSRADVIAEVSASKL